MDDGIIGGDNNDDDSEHSADEEADNDSDNEENRSDEDDTLTTNTSADGPPSDSNLRKVASKIIDSSFGRHFSSEAMKIGTKNESFILALLFKQKGTTTSDSDLRKAARKTIGSSFGRHFSSDAMKIGTKNELFIVALLFKQKVIQSIFDIGLVRMKMCPWIEVSADGVAILCPPSARQYTVTSSVEIKTVVAHGTINKRSAIARKYGVYFTCTV
ncbi:hypothetical protein SARC_07427 [Sphaeroforma arctica JP610]|uniref:YqaJ viral recombinase domain-containing protein n=1 Tax=Sphaeroforma arctica JP610 TaxID=667725 RepID=A0A0L0FUH5_9EUKA|nr:hypothetical protein SARC_07427 [Sphaeroforma arctica JP610]KNC80201.1 hypothetical protein SARC_07427 [Sphaeroforma arctica JP610]|eukprot:XP_014154103.1 hypothetical protein SARC_07427 [Sphaeroforma arctica JP610]